MTQNATDRRHAELAEAQLRGTLADCESVVRSAAWHVDRDIELGRAEQIVWVAERLLILADKALADCRAAFDAYLDDDHASWRAHRHGNAMREQLELARRYARVAEDASMAAYADRDPDDADPDTVELRVLVLVEPDEVDIDTDHARRLAARQPELDESALRYALCQQAVRRWPHARHPQIADWSVVRREDSDPADVVRIEVSVIADDEAEARDRLRQIVLAAPDIVSAKIVDASDDEGDG